MHCNKVIPESYIKIIEICDKKRNKGCVIKVPWQRWKTICDKYT